MEHAHGEENRVVAASVSMIAKCGITIVSIYFHDGQGPASEANMAIMQAVAAFLATIDGPWVICADFNCTPAELKSTGWAQMIGGEICATEGPTCGAHRYDFFVVEKNLAQTIAGIHRVTDAGFFPHVPERLLLRASESRRMVRRLVKPPLIPGSLPFGPPTAENAARAAATTTLVQGDTLDAQAASWITEARIDFSARCGEHVTKGQDFYFRWETAVRPKSVGGGSLTHEPGGELQGTVRPNSPA